MKAREPVNLGSFLSLSLTLAAAPYCEQASASNCGSASETSERSVPRLSGSARAALSSLNGTCFNMPEMQLSCSCSFGKEKDNYDIKSYQMSFGSFREEKTANIFEYKYSASEFLLNRDPATKTSF